MPNNEINMNDNSAIVQDDASYNKKIKPIPKPKHNDSDLVDKGIATKISEMGTANNIDISAINSFTQIAQTRDRLYQLLDVMGDDPTVAAVLETYAEDATEYNDKGQII